MRVNTTTHIDLRTVAPQERHPLVFSAFENLPLGASFALTNDHDPQPLQQQLQARYGDEFSWIYLESGPLVWKVQISKAAVASSNCCSGGACCG